jgi:predicted ArsR family transcriptional regulator
VADLPDAELARVLAVPLRRRIFDLVAAADHPLAISELTAALGCNHNAVRQHLARLCAAGLVTETSEPRSAPGRPRLLYAPAVRPHPYAHLATLLARVVRDGGTPRTVGRREGRASGPSSTVADRDAVDVIEAEAAKLGFAPTRVEHGERVDIVLGVCPFADVAAGDPRTICSLHRGLVEGLADAAGGARVDGFVAHEPYEAGCEIHLRRDARR